MASIASDPGGQRRILFMDRSGKRQTLRLGKCDKKTAESVRLKVEMVLSATYAGLPFLEEVRAWLRGVSPALQNRMERVGLIIAAKEETLQAFLDSYILNRSDVKPATIEVWQQPCRNLIEYFGAGRMLRTITAGEAEQFKAWLSTQKLATATFAKRLSFARTFFNHARKHKFIDENPFAVIRIPIAAVSERQHFIDPGMTDLLLAAASPTWRIILALSRYGGLRCPSEVLSLEWAHIDWPAQKITVVSPKTSRYQGKDRRQIPLFPELQVYLEEARQLAALGQTHIVGGDYLARAASAKGWRNCNLRTSFEKLIKRAGLEPWPRLFHNLRSSRETELLNKGFPLHVVANWMGHNAKISLKHFAQTTDEHFERAVSGGSSGAKSSSSVAQFPAQQAAAASGEEKNWHRENADKQGKCATHCETLTNDATIQSGGEGIRTLGTVLPVRGFSKAVLSTTQPPLRRKITLPATAVSDKPRLARVHANLSFGGNNSRSA